ncbi:MAG: SusD/RagB family nutrient-binding outer membrane lipoprotein [Bacteroidales bacterium]|nr:SusD/RagB family nutrient-binding outer membrane lipoprotein [Bacteroidales bacterium]MDT8431404.1 SusD/RagB family nutrient-binding outer membrane lipoprotein [Bacteroidales bacterium]
MKKIFIITLIISVFVTSCESWLDVNTSPNSSTTAAPDDLFAYAATAYGANRAGGDNYMPIGFMNQAISTGGSFGWGYAEDRYDISPYSLGNTWKAYYSTSGNNLQLAIDIAEGMDPAANNSAAQAKILLAEMVYECTMIYGDMPYSQAWNDDYAYPEFDAQADILNGLIQDIDAAIEQIDPADPIRIIESDLFYKGDLDKWVRLANSIKLRIYMTMYDKDPSVADDIAALLNGDLIASADDNFLFPFFDEPQNENIKFKLFDRYANGQNLWIFANKNVFDFMAAYDDPRIPVYFDEGPEAAEGEFKAVETATEADATTSTISMYLYRPDAPEVIFSYSEMLFFLAEIHARGIGVAADLNTAARYFEEAVEQAMLFCEVPQADIDDFLASDLPDISTMSAEDALYEIHVQHWIDLMDRTLEGWVQSRRSGDAGNEVPNLQLPNGAPAGGIMRRWPYPDDELTGNINAPSALPQIYDKLWFDK